MPILIAQEDDAPHLLLLESESLQKSHSGGGTETSINEKEGVVGDSKVMKSARLPDILSS